MMDQKELNNLFSKKLKPIIDAKTFLSTFFQSIEKTITTNPTKIKIFDPNNNAFKFFISHKFHLDFFLKRGYSSKDFHDLYKNSVNKTWIFELKKVIFQEIKSTTDKNFNLLMKRKENEKNELFFEDQTNVLFRILLEVLRKPFLRKNLTEIENNILRNFGLESSWLYNEFGKGLSDFYFRINLDAKKKRLFILELKTILNTLDSSCKDFFIEKKIDLIKLYKKFNDNCYFITNDDLCRHFFCKIIVDLIYQKDTKFNFLESQCFSFMNLYFSKISSNLLNVILVKFFDKKIYYEGVRTYNYYKFKNDLDQFTFNINNKLPSLSEESYDFDIHNDLNFDLNQNISLKKKSIHQNFKLHFQPKKNTLAILDRLKARNKYCINVSFLLDIISIFESKDVFFLNEIYGVDLVTISKQNVNKNYVQKLINWSFDLNDLKTKILPSKNSKYFFFFEKIVNRIYSYKISIYYMIQQSCIMSCFDGFYYDWFFDSRGRFYVENNSLSLQGSSLSRLMTMPYKFKNFQLEKENLNLMKKTLKSYLNNDSLYNFDNPKALTLLECKEVKIKLSEFFNFYVMQQDFCDKQAKRTNYALDASSSGFQMLSLILRNRNLGLKCGLLINDSKNIYQEVLNYISKFFELNRGNSKYLVFTELYDKLPNMHKMLTNKKLTKYPIMTIPYNSTQIGRIDQMRKVYVDECFLDGIIFTFQEYKDVGHFFRFIDKLIVDWCNLNLPECRKLKEEIKSIIYKTDVNVHHVCFKHYNFFYKNRAAISKRLKLGVKGKGTEKSKIGVAIFIDQYTQGDNSKLLKKALKKTENSFVANMIHGVDAQIALDLTCEFLKKGINFYTIHDCFRIDFKFAKILRSCIVEAYIKLFDFDFMSKNKHLFNVKFKTEMQTLCKKELIKNLNIEFFVKE